MKKLCNLAFRKGDAVKLKDRYAEALCQSPKSKINWRDRRGIVARCGDNYVDVVWPGRRSFDQIPVNGVEKS